MIARWKLKAAVEKALSLLPSPERANYWFQKNITKGVILTDEHLGHKIRHAKDHIHYFKTYGKNGHHHVVIELGTGWYPIIPTMLYLTNSAEKVISLDIQNWLTKEGFLYALERIGEWKDQGKLTERFGEVDKSKWSELIELTKTAESVDELKEKIGLETRLVDARKTGLASESVDYICSNNTFEHIYPDVLMGILKEFKRVIKPGGVMSHFIDMTDHFAHFDPSITVYNYLKYSQKRWSMIDNSIQPQNRLRLIEYEDMYRELVIPITEKEVWPIDLEALRSVAVHKEFDRFSEDQLAIQHAYIVSQF